MNLKFAITAAVIISITYMPVPSSHAANPPANSPMALGVHPRLFFTVNELPGLRDRIATYYQTEFQEFITLLNDTSALSSGQKAIENHWGGFNYAFIAALDPQQMRSKGFTFSAALDTSQEYCDKAISYARNLLTDISAATSQSHSDVTTGYPDPLYFPVAATYDWCYSQLSSTDKTSIVDAFVSAYNKRYAGINTLNDTGIGIGGMMANNQASADIHDILGIIAFYNDPYPSSTVQSDMYDAFYDIWINRVLVELNYFYKHGTGWHEGSGGYVTEGLINLGIPIEMFSAAMATDYISATPFFSTYPLFAEANVKPHGLLFQCGPSGIERCPEFFERWGTISGGISGIGCKPALLISGMLRKSNHSNAPLAKWVHEQTENRGCSDTVTRYGGTWSNAVLFWFLYSDRESTAQSATQLNIDKTQKLGLGEYVMRSGYSSTDSQVVFWAKEHNMYGHESAEYGAFSLHKFGNLILRGANSKSGDATINKSKKNVFRNLIGIHKGTSDPQLSFNGHITDPFFGARGISKIEIAGTLLAESINNSDYDYIAYDNSPSWDSTTADISQREFVYLRGPLDKEYLVIFDRMNVISPSIDEKIWKIWIPAEPVFENGTPTNPRTGKWSSTNTDTVSMTNQFSSLVTNKFESAPTHGKFFMKTLSPNNPRINVLGGPGKEFQSGDDDGSTPWGSPSMTQGMHEYLGWGRIEVRPTVAQNYDTFLNVIQFGDSNTLSSISNIIRVNSSDNKMIGSHINEPDNQWVVLFAKNASDVSTIGSATYVFVPSSSTSNHLLVNMQPSTTYYITASSGGSGTTVTAGPTQQSGSFAMTTTANGVLNFSLDGLTVVVDTTPPVPPLNLSVQ